MYAATLFLKSTKFAIRTTWNLDVTHAGHHVSQGNKQSRCLRKAKKYICSKTANLNEDV